MQRNGSGTACASCKHQRKKCGDKCVLATFFPADKNREFQAVHKVFGVSKVTKMLKNLREEDWKKAVDSLVWEAFCRQRDPVLGPYGEYRKLHEELKFYKTQYHQQFHVATTQAPYLVGWNDNNNNHNHNHNHHHGILCNNNRTNMGREANRDNHGGSSITDSTPYVYGDYSSIHHHVQQGLERARQEEEVGSVVTLPQHTVDGLNQQSYYLSG